METKRIVRDSYNTIAQAYLATRHADSEDVQLLQALIARLPRGARVLDAGCGAGVPITQILSQYFDVLGIDISEAQLALARQFVPGAQFVRADLSALGFPAETFDAICSYYAIIHVPREEHRALLQNFYHLLKPSGLALLCMGNGDLADDVATDYFGTTMYWSHYDAETNLRIMRDCGFQILWSKPITDTLDANATHLFVLAEK